MALNLRCCVCFCFLHHWRRSSHWLLNWLLRNGLAHVLIFVFMFVSHCVSVCVRERDSMCACRQMFVNLLISVCVCRGCVCWLSRFLFCDGISLHGAARFLCRCRGWAKASAGPRGMALRVLGMPTHPSLRKHRQNKGARRHAQNTRVFAFLRLHYRACVSQRSLHATAVHRRRMIHRCSSPQTWL